MKIYAIKRKMLGMQILPFLKRKAPSLSTCVAKTTTGHSYTAIQQIANCLNRKTTWCERIARTTAHALG